MPRDSFAAEQAVGEGAVVPAAAVAAVSTPVPWCLVAHYSLTWLVGSRLVSIAVAVEGPFTAPTTEGKLEPDCLPVLVFELSTHRRR